RAAGGGRRRDLRDILTLEGVAERHVEWPARWIGGVDSDAAARIAVHNSGDRGAVGGADGRQSERNGQTDDLRNVQSCQGAGKCNRERPTLATRYRGAAQGRNGPQVGLDVGDCLSAASGSDIYLRGA